MWLDWQFIDFVIGFGPIEFLWFDGLDFSFLTYSFEVSVFILCNGYVTSGWFGWVARLILVITGCFVLPVLLSDELFRLYWLLNLGRYFVLLVFLYLIDFFVALILQISYFALWFVVWFI
eukprot:gene13167-9013_t